MQTKKGNENLNPTVTAKKHITRTTLEHTRGSIEETRRAIPIHTETPTTDMSTNKARTAEEGNGETEAYSSTVEDLILNAKRKKERGRRAAEVGQGGAHSKKDRSPHGTRRPRREKRGNQRHNRENPQSIDPTTRGEKKAEAIRRTIKHPADQTTKKEARQYEVDDPAWPQRSSRTKQGGAGDIEGNMVRELRDSTPEEDTAQLKNPHTKRPNRGTRCSGGNNKKTPRRETAAHEKPNNNKKAQRHHDAIIPWKEQTKKQGKRRHDTIVPWRGKDKKGKNNRKGQENKQGITNNHDPIIPYEEQKNRHDRDHDRIVPWKEPDKKKA